MLNKHSEGLVSSVEVSLAVAEAQKALDEMVAVRDRLLPAAEKVMGMNV